MRAPKEGGPHGTAWDPMFVLRPMFVCRLQSCVAAMCLAAYGCSLDAVPVTSPRNQFRADVTADTISSAMEGDAPSEHDPRGDALRRSGRTPVEPAPAEGEPPPAAEGESEPEAEPEPEPSLEPEPEPTAPAKGTAEPAAPAKPAAMPPDMPAAPMAAPEPKPDAEPMPEPPPPAPMPEGRCDLPACVPAAIRACRGRGECSRDLTDSRRCFDNGIRMERRRSQFGDIVTVRREDGSKCFSIAMGTDMTTGEIGAAYRDGDDQMFAVAGMSGGFWGFRCMDGGTKAFDTRACSLYGDVPPGVSSPEICRVDETCEPDR